MTLQEIKTAKKLYQKIILNFENLINSIVDSDSDLCFFKADIKELERAKKYFIAGKFTKASNTLQNMDTYPREQIPDEFYNAIVAIGELSE